MPRHAADIEHLRHNYRPERVTTLFVGESAPISGAFFYDGNTQLYRFMKTALGGGEPFLAEFQSRSFFFDDLVLFPVNHKTPSERRRLHRKWMPSLAQRMRDYEPLAVVTVLIGIRKAVKEAMAGAGLSDVPHYGVPFPGNGQQLRFLHAMSQIVPKLPALRLMPVRTE
jgi:hypothetical protein